MAETKSRLGPTKRAAFHLAADDNARSSWARRFLGWRLDRPVVMCVLWRDRVLTPERERAQLVAEGVRFSDLTMIFSDVKRPIYIDDCCHVDRFGYSLIAAELGRMARSDEALQ